MHRHPYPFHAMPATPQGAAWTRPGKGHKRPHPFFRALYRLTGWGL